MSARKLCCQGCGADLEVAEGIRFVTCNYCGARMEIVHDATTTHSRVLDKIEKTTGEMAGDLKVIRLQNELEQLDREWEQERSRFLTRDKNGNASEPSPAAAIVGGVLAIGFGIFWISTASSMGAPGIFPLFGLVFIGFVLFGIISSLSKSQGLRSSEEQYRTRRVRMLAEIERVKRP
jgi:hypothetical protein